MYFILKTKYTLILRFVPAQVCGNNHWSSSQVRLNILNYRTLIKASTACHVEPFHWHYSNATSFTGGKSLGTRLPSDKESLTSPSRRLSIVLSTLLANLDLPYSFIILRHTKRTALENCFFINILQMPKLQEKFAREMKSDARVLACRFPLPDWQPEAVICAGIDTVWRYRKSSAKTPK